MNLAALAKQISAGSVPMLELHAVDPVIYLVYVRDGSQLTPLQDDAGGALRFPSRFAACRALREAGVAGVQFVHHSAYDEMIGLPSTGGGAQLREFITL